MNTPLLLLAAALFVSSWGTPRRRISAGQSRRDWALPAITLATVAALLVIASDRAGLVIALAIFGATALHAWQRRVAQRERQLREELAAEFLGHLVANVEAGAPLATACRRATRRLPEHTPQALREDIANLGSSAQTPELARVSALWEVSARRGVPIAALLQAARDELDAALRHRSATTAALAGPKTTALILCALPLVGIAMGASMGARPIHFLTSPGLGSVCLVIGTALVSAGFYSSNAIIERATP